MERREAAPRTRGTSRLSLSPSAAAAKPGSAAFPRGFAGLEELAPASGHAPAAVETLAGDVGRRRYLRLRLPDGRTVLGVSYPEDESDSRMRWLRGRAALAGHVRVPEVLADDGRGNQIVEDFGADDLALRLAGRTETRAAELASAVDAAAAIARIADPAINPAFDFALFRRELELAREAVFDLHLARPLSAEERAAHDRWADDLCREILSHPTALCHRDFHGNNLFCLEGEIAAIDFQDMRTGPDTYDVASLLWERTTLDWMTPALADEMIARFARSRSLDAAEVGRRLRRVLLQRAWKVCGTFARAVSRGAGDAYRRYLPGEIALVGRLLGDGAADRDFRRVYDARLRPLLS